MKNIKSIKEQIKEVLYKNYKLTTKISKAEGEETLGITYSAKKDILTVTIYAHEFAGIGKNGDSQLVAKENYKPDFWKVISDVKTIIKKETSGAAYEIIAAKGFQYKSKLRIRFNKGDE